MTPAPGEPSPDPGTDPGTDVEQIQAEIEKTRQALGETLEALSAKTDVKARVGAKVDHTRTRLREAARDDQGDLKPAIPAAAAVVAVGIVVLLAWRSRSRSR